MEDFGSLLNVCRTTLYPVSSMPVRLWWVLNDETLERPWTRHPFLSMLHPSLHSSPNRLPSNFIPAVYKREQKDWIMVLLVSEPEVQINSETIVWPRKLSLEINIAGEWDMVCPSRTGLHSVCVYMYVCVCVRALCGWKDGPWFTVSPSGNTLFWSTVLTVDV